MKSLVYRKIAAAQVDPIEKKPLYHFLPGTRAFSIATQGCNLACPFCQNHSLSLAVRERDFITGEYLEPLEVVRMAERSQSKSICYTYSEPTIYFETMKEIAEEARGNNLYNCVVSNGYISERPLESLLPLIDAVNIDLKCYSEDGYRKVLKGELEVVKRTIRAMKENGVWIEVTTLIVPDFNDGEEELRALTEFIAGLSPEIPWHVSRYHPVRDNFSECPTAEEKIMLAIKIGESSGLKNIYAGNVRMEKYNDTRCSGCGEVLIRRDGFFGTDSNVGEDGSCPKCKTRLAGVFK